MNWLAYIFLFIAFCLAAESYTVAQRLDRTLAQVETRLGMR
jgi:hypothetical protein